MKKEYLQFGFEVKELEDKNDGFFRFEGFANAFDDVDRVDDIVRRGAFTESLKTRTPKVLWQHRSNEPIGMPELTEERKEGLFVRAKLPLADTFVSGRVIPQIKVGSIDTMSIGFTIGRGGAFFNEDGIREITKATLYEFSPVTFEANEKAKITGFKSLESLFKGIDLSDDEKQKLIQEIKASIKFDYEDLKFLEKAERTVRGLETALVGSKLFSNKAAVLLSSVLKSQSDSDNEGENQNGEDEESKLLDMFKRFEDDQVLIQKVNQINNALRTK